MRIVLDMQGAQTASRFRGIGRYTVSMAQALLRRESEHEIFLAFNASMPEAIKDVLQQLGDLIKDEHILIWCGPRPVRDDNEDNSWRRRVAQECYKTFLQDIKADLLFISSYFEGYRDNAVTCVAEPEFGFSTCIVVFDLIPLLNAEQYFVDKVYARHYQRKLSEIQRAAGALTISNFSRGEAIQHLSFRSDQIVNTYLGAEDKFRPLLMDPAKRQSTMIEFNLDRPFILYAGGSDERKNLPRLMKAFAALPERMRQSYQLLLAGKFDDIDQTYLERLVTELGLAAESVRFTGYISDDTLIELYNVCTLFVFPSWHEGFGLPVLEAMACGAPAIAANCSSLPEVLAYPEAMFDPFDVEAISRKIAEVLDDEVLRQNLVEHGIQRAKKFTWALSAAIAMEKFDQILSEQLKKPALAVASAKQSLRKNYQHLIECIAALSAEQSLITDQDLREVAHCIDVNLAEARRVLCRVQLPADSQWYLKSEISYDLAQALRDIGQCLNAHAEEADIVLSQLPQELLSVAPTQVQLSYGLRLQQSIVPEDWILALNQRARGIVVASNFLRKLLIDAGVYVPIAVQAEGVDGWTQLIAAQNVCPPVKKYRFVCDIFDIERDGFDVLLRAYDQAFSAADDVSLLVLVDSDATASVREYVEAWQENNADCPSVCLVPAVNDAVRKAIFLESQCFVAPWRFQDVCTPVTRVLELGLSILTTGWGGQVEASIPEEVGLIHYRFVRSSREPLSFNAYLAEPDEKHLAELMLEQFTKEKYCQFKQTPQVSACSWRETAIELNRLVRVWSAGPLDRPLQIGWVTSWNTRCGIATYSEHLTECISEDVVIFAPRHAERLGVDCDNVVRCWDQAEVSLDDLNEAIRKQGISTLVVQFNYGFFNFSAFSEFLLAQVERRVKVVVVMHSTVDPLHASERRLSSLALALGTCHRVLVHSVGDMNRLKHIGLTENVTLFPHGVRMISSDDTLVGPLETKSNSVEKFVIASYGFFLPHKGLLELIEAVALLREGGHNVSLNMLNAEYPIGESYALISEARLKIEALGLSKHVRLTTEFLADAQSLFQLKQADLVVYPYQDTGESASGAVRFGLASMTPVAVTPLTIFEDVNEAVFQLPGFTAAQIAAGVREVMQELGSGTDAVTGKLNRARDWCLAHQYPSLANRLVGMLKAALN